MLNIDTDIDTVRASRAGHTFHERWAARRALQLVFPSDDLFAIAVEGISSTETASPGARAEEVADLVLYYGRGDNFQTCERLETVQFKYKLREEAVTASYLKKTIEKFSDTILGYEKEFSAADADKKASFIFVTNSEFTESLWDAIMSLIEGTSPSAPGAATQARNLRKWCSERGLSDASRLFSRIVFRAGEKSLAGQDNALRRTLTDWSAGADSEARLRLHGLQDLVLKKAGPSGQGKNLIRREDVLDALDCEPEDLFPADTRFIDVGAVVERAELSTVGDLIKASELPVFVHAEGGVGKTVFVQSLASKMANEFEVVVFDCFGGGSYRSDNHSRHLPRIGLVQIVNELASRTLCDLMLPGGDDSRKIIKAARRRLAQAATAIRTQSKKLGLLIIVDAADNAQLEAECRHEEAFPKLLLSTIDEDSIDGVKLLLTARTHRKKKVIGRTAVKDVELGPFTDPEARKFLKDRKPSASGVEIATALARSGRNARVLDYLVQTWDTNVLGKTSAAPITVPEIIAQRCTKIVSDLHVEGWRDSEVTEFFVALSLLPPPIPLEELANALGWSAAQVNTAASDLAPMLEITSHGAIFRDEPTETYVRETFSERPEAQRTIADRLISSQATSAYAAEALPHFLVVIKDSDRAFALADSTSFPTTVQSEFGRRRLTLARLRAAFRLAVAEDDFDRVLGLSMRLAQAATANMRGDEFIRSSPALAIVLGDADSYRRLFSDRSGWRGARSARLTVAHRFANNTEEAQIQCESTVRWINWHTEQPRDERLRDRAGPGVEDYAAVLFQHVAEGEFGIADRNLARWNDRFSLSASDELLQLLALFDRANGTTVLADFVSFAASDQCTSQALKLRLLSRPRYLSRQQVKALAKAIGTPASADDDEDEGFSIEHEQGNSGDIVQAALTSLFYSSRAATAAIIRHAPLTRPSAYDYGERYGNSRAWSPILCACVRAWSVGRPVSYRDLLPNELKVTRRAKAVSTKTELVAFLKELREPVPAGPSKKGGKNQVRARFSDREREEISEGIERALVLTRPIEDAVLSGKGLTSASVNDILDGWGKQVREGGHWRAESAADLLVRTVGLGCVRILLNHAPTISADQTKTLISLISSGRFSVQQKIDVLGQLTQRSALHELAGEFAQHVTEQIRQDDNIGQRGDSYAELAASLVPMSVDEAREYYQQGLAQLDQMGGESYEQIYSLLHFASVQQGGFLKPELAQRLMNLCQTIVRNEPSKFGWTLFGRAAAKSIGFPAIAKLVRWHDQDVADLSYGLPQLACFLAKNGNLDPRRAAFVLTICEDHGWWDWRSGDGVADLLKLSRPADQRRIFLAVVAKLRAEHPFGAWPSLWEGLLETGNQYPNAITTEEREAIERRWAEAKRKQDEFNSRNNSPPDFLTIQTPKPSKEEVDSLIATLVSDCDPSSASSIDKALKNIQADDKLDYASRQRFIVGLRASCPYPKRLALLFAVCDAVELNLTQSLDILAECFAAWSGSSTHLVSNAKTLVERLFECKSAELFDGQFSNTARGIRQLSDLCNDKRYVLQLVLRKVAADEVELDGDEWLQLATALCDVTSGQAGLDALELLLSGPASRIADEIGEGPFRPEQAIGGGELEFFADVVWHLLGEDDAYVRWTVARGLNTLFEFGLNDELNLLLDRFDQREVAALASTDRKLSFQNSQQWLLMGLARAALHHGQTMRSLQPKLLALAQRSDLHVIDKVHIARCLSHINSEGEHDADLEALLDQIDQPPCGIVTSDVYPSATKSTSGFRFDYEFTKHEISTLAWLFNVEQATVEDAITAEITRRWPEATSMDFFPGSERYQWDRGDRYESYREHIQRHALLNATTSLSKALPVVVRSYETGGGSPWMEWRDRYDVTFDDGSWLSDRKDPVPQQAKENLLGERIGQQEMLQDQETVLRKLGFVDTATDALFPLYGSWSSPDGVTVSITSALTERNGAIGRCMAFAKQPSHDLWLPEFWDEGYYNHHHRPKSPFAPFVWAPETHSLGIDVGDEIAAEGPGGRPRLGIDLTKSLELVNEPNSGDWHTADGSLALRSQVWGSWTPDPDNRRHRRHEDGEILWASPDWLAATLSTVSKRLVFKITLWKYRSSRDYDPSSGVKSVLVGLKVDDGTPRLWQAKKASKQDY
ncbi:NACHT domain-containing protein [Noviherbaspirillum sedimenti]|uniref:NACHT domain-containing protein n=1 Tax=Noviherbaspirillum sedimenti TaxID=2320865 RepID=A0A3A3GKZ0_9BURK|nr:NACHT domain-containing protein [Noviherbaspirillum sedimenti]RJG01630.1 NACHT domain-containing protein [Noviherbaspirillum sedimenti]